MTVFAEEVHINEGQYEYVDDIDEYLAQLNAGFSLPPINTNKTIFYSMEESTNPYISVSPMSWPWTDCSNILGHDWSVWTETKRIHNGHSGDGYCTAAVDRFRCCQRTHCGAVEHETGTIHVLCIH